MVMPGMPPQMGMDALGGMLGQPGALPAGDPLSQFASMARATALADPEPVYPRWFRQPKRPDPKGMHDAAITLFGERSFWRAAVGHDLEMLRMQHVGLFKNDIPDWKAGYIEPYRSTGLVDEFNLAVSWLSGLKRRVTKDQFSDDLKAATRKVRLVAEWLDQVESVAHTDKLEMEKAILEPKILLSYGMVVKRRVLDRDAEDYASPFLVDYIDPAQVVPIVDSRGLEAVFRVYACKVRDLVRVYGDFTPSALRRIKAQYGEDIGDETELTEVVEYWDRWFRCVTVSGATVLPVTEHKYGEVPYTIGFGPLGEPNLTTMPDETGAAAQGSETWREALAHKSVGYVRFRKISHAMQEAMLARELLALQQEMFPSVVRYRSMMAAQEPAPELEAYPLAQNEAMLGEERIEALPRNPSSHTARQVLLDAMERDRITGSAPMSAYGHMDHSNISGTANKQANSAGLHLWKPWAKHLEGFASRDLSLALRLWKRVGHRVEFAHPKPRPFRVPLRHAAKGDESSFVLDKGTLLAAGCDVAVKVNSVNTDEWLLRAQTMKLMREEGFPREFLADELFGIEYDAYMSEEWREEQMLAKMMEHPKFLEIIGIPSKVLSEMAEAAGNPAQEALLADWYQKWDEIVVQPAMLEHQMRMQQMQAQPGPDEAVPVGAAPPEPGGPQAGPAPATDGVSLPEMGMGPGSRTGVMGGPRGPVGPRGPGAY